MEPLSAIAIALIKLFGPTLARIVFAKVLKDRVELAAISSGDLAETLADSLDIGGIVDRLTAGAPGARRRAEYLFNEIGEKAATNLGEIFRHEGVALEEAERQFVVEAAQRTLNHHALTLLINQQLDSHRFRRALRRVAPPYPLESEPQTALYEAILERSAEMLFAVADQVPHFTRDSTARLLQDTNTLLNQMEMALGQLARILEQTYGQQQATEAQRFESSYRIELARSLDNMTIFGVEQFDGAKQPLTVAYIRLQVAMARPQLATQHEGKQNDTGYTGHDREQLVVVEEAMASSKRLLIIAEAGAGKTTLLRWVAVQTAHFALEAPLDDWHNRLPFYVQLRNYADKPLPTFRDLPFTVRELQPLAGSEPSNYWVANQLRNERGLVLVDGLDEISEGKRHETMSWLDTLLAQYPKTIVLVSTRPSGLNTQTIAQQLQQLEFQPLRLGQLQDEQVTECIHQWHLAMQHEQCTYPNKSLIAERESRLLEVLKQRKDLQSLTRTPLLCSMICALHLIELSELPRDRIRLYERCINLLLNRDLNRNIDPGDVAVRPRPETMRRLLARIAYWMLKHDPAIIRRTDAERILAREAKDPDQVLTYLAGRSVLLRQQAVDEYDFVHRTFLEFLAAEQIVQEHEVASVVGERGLASEWHETLRLIAGHAHAQDKETLLKELYLLSQHQSDQRQRRTLHLLAWDFWALLDVRPGEAQRWVANHIASLNLYGASGLDLSSTQVSDLTPLAGLSNLRHLYLSSTQVSDLTPLAGLSNLQHLYLSSIQVSDLTPLARLSNLQHLGLRNTQVSDLTPLAGLPNLQHLDLSSTQVSDLTSLAGLSNLQHLDLRNTQVSDLTPLAGLPNLQHLDLWNTQVSDLTPLARLPNLQHLDLSETHVNDLTPLVSLINLQHLDLNGTQVNDLTPLNHVLMLGKLRITLDSQLFEKQFDQLTKLPKLLLCIRGISDLTLLVGLTNLQHLHLSGTQVNDLSALTSLTNLQHLDLSFIQVNDLSALTNLTNLQHLDLSGSQVSDLTPLAGLSNLQHLDLWNTQVSDLTPLAGLSNLQHLYLWNTQVSDLAPLVGLSNLQHLYLSYTQVSDLTPLVGLSNLQHLDLRGTQVSHLTPIHNWAQVRIIA